jgi:hypothetical protein
MYLVLRLVDPVLLEAQLVSESAVGSGIEIETGRRTAIAGMMRSQDERVAPEVAVVDEVEVEIGSGRRLEAEAAVRMYDASAEIGVEAAIENGNGGEREVVRGIGIRIGRGLEVGVVVAGESRDGIKLNSYD